MMRTALAMLALVAAAGSSRADTLPLITDAPSGYTPGTPFTFNISAPGLTGLVDYQITMTVTAGTPPGLPDLVVTAASATTEYAFAQDGGNFNVTYGSDAASGTYSVIMSDFTNGLGVNTAPGDHDNLATVSISPGVNLSGPIVIGFTQNDFTTSRDVGFDLPAPLVIPELPPAPAVPAPPALVLVVIAGACLVARQRLRK